MPSNVQQNLQGLFSSRQTKLPLDLRLSEVFAVKFWFVQMP
jgi:hypothetical protein